MTIPKNAAFAVGALFVAMLLGLVFIAGHATANGSSSNGSHYRSHRSGYSSYTKHHSYTQRG